MSEAAGRQTRGGRTNARRRGTGSGEEQAASTAIMRRSRLSNIEVIAQSGESIRFFLVALAGLAIDIGIAWALIALAGAADAVASVTGFAVATVVNYFAHQFWTFQAGERKASMRRFLGFTAAILLTLVVRLAVLDMLGAVLPGSGLEAPLRLGLAAGVSFIVSFLLSKLYVFRGSPDARLD